MNSEINQLTEAVIGAEAQVLTYLKLSHCRVGLLINFRVRMLKDGLRRLAL
jgi:GxxExxY protein